MLEFIGGVVVFVFLILFGCYLYSYIKNKKNDNSAPFSSLTENELVKKFNNLADSLTSKSKRSIDKIASEMLAVLKEYKCKKIEQFVESTQMLTKNKNHLNEEIAKVNSLITKLKADAMALNKENMTDEDYEIGAMYMAQIEDTEKLKQDLIDTLAENDKQLERVDKQVKSFNAKYTIKEGSITNMIIKAKTHKNFSAVDLKLNDLISEFNDKVTDIEIEQRVKSQIAGTEHTDDEDKSPNFLANKEKYVEKFKNMINSK